MKIGHFLAALALSFGLLVPQFAWAVDYVAGPGSAAAPGQIIGTPTNDNATAGNVGEYQSNTCPAQTATVTFTGTTTNLVTWAANTFVALCPVYFTTSGSLPSGISASTTYYVTNNANLTTASFQISTTIALAQAGTAIALTTNGTATTTGTGSSVLGTGTALAQNALYLTAGDWDVQCTLAFTANSSTTATVEQVGVSTSSTVIGQIGTFTVIDATMAATDASSALVSPIVRESLSTTTPIYCLGASVFATSVMTANPMLRARRVR